MFKLLSSDYESHHSLVTPEATKCFMKVSQVKLETYSSASFSHL